MEINIFIIISYYLPLDSNVAYNISKYDLKKFF